MDELEVWKSGTHLYISKTRSTQGYNSPLKKSRVCCLMRQAG